MGVSEEEASESEEGVNCLAAILEGVVSEVMDGERLVFSCVGSRHEEVFRDVSVEMARRSRSLFVHISSIKVRTCPSSTNPPHLSLKQVSTASHSFPFPHASPALRIGSQHPTKHVLAVAEGISVTKDLSLLRVVLRPSRILNHLSTFVIRSKDIQEVPNRGSSHPYIPPPPSI